MPCSRIDAPFAQCEPRLIGESNTGSWRIHTPFCDDGVDRAAYRAVRAHRALHFDVRSRRLIRRLRFVDDAERQLAQPPRRRRRVMPERLRNVRRSMVAPEHARKPDVSGGCVRRAAPVDLRVNMEAPQILAVR